MLCSTGGKIHDLPLTFWAEHQDFRYSNSLRKMSGRAFRKAINKEYDKRINDEDSNDSEDTDRPLPKSNL